MPEARKPAGTASSFVPNVKLKSTVIYLWLALCWFGFCDVAFAGGTWASLASSPPAGVNMCLLLGDGTVLGMNGDGTCVKLTPNSSGSYRNGTWTTVAHMNDDRLFFASALLTNGNVFVAGGEYGAGHDHAELYDPLNNVWTRIPDPVPGVGFSDAISKILPNGNVLVAPVSLFGGCRIYNVYSNTWQTAASSQNQNEVCWVKLPNDNIITIDTGAQTSEHYVPSLNQWIVDGNVPVPVYGYGAEIGGGFLLPNGKVFYVGGNTNTAIYTPGATVSSAGSWVASATIPNNLGAVDAPAAMLVNGKILCALGPVGGFNGPSSYYEYDYTTDSFTQVNAPGGGTTYGPAPFATSMLDLPDGTVLFVGGQNSTSLYIYTPDGTPLAAGQPGINTITENTDGSYHLTGTNLNGISEGAAYGDDEQMDSNYPLVRMTNSTSGNVYYARTFNRSSTSVMTSNLVLSTEFSLPQNLPTGTYSLVVVANGNPSAPTNFVYSPPAVPTGLAAISGSNALVKLSWNTSAGATAYNLKRSASSTGYFATIATLTGTTYTNTGLINGFTYYYKVAAVGSGGPSADSTSVNATPAGPPPVPTGLAAVGGANGFVPLSWSPSFGATSYNLKRATVNGGPYNTVFSVAGTNYNDANVTNGVAYYYVLTAVGPNGESAATAQVNATPLAPVVVTWFKADAITGLGNGAAVASWTDSSGNGFTAAQATAGQRPTYSTAAVNGLPVVHFNSASSQNLTFNRPIQDNFTMFCVFRSTQGLNSGTLFWQGAGLVNGEVAGTANDFGTCLFANGQVSAGIGNPDTSINSLANYNDGKPHLMSWKRAITTGKVELYMDGALAGSFIGNLNSLTAPAKLALGAQQTGNNFLTGDLGEVKIYSSALSDTDRAAQESGLMTKWGITNALTLAGNVVVNLDATALPTGSLAYITNNGSAGGVFQSYTNTGVGPQVIAVGGGTRGVLFDGNSMLVHNTSLNGSAQYAPANLTSTSFTGFSVEAWVYEPTTINDSPVVSWGTRGNCGGQISCAYGSSTSWGALAIWCNDHGWGTQPAIGQWHYLVWTLWTNGVETLYADGVTNATYTGITPSVDPNNNICIAFSHGNTAGSLAGGVNGGCEIVGRVRVMDGILTSQQVANNFATEKGAFTNGTPAFLTTAPLHRWSFTNAVNANATGLVVTDIGSANGTTNQINGLIRNNGGTAAFTGSQLTLSGGSSATAPYVDFTNALISVLSTNRSGSGQLTVEAWLTPQAAGNWARVFECGSTTSGKITAPGGTFTGVNYAGLVATPSGSQNQSGVAFGTGNYSFSSTVTGTAMHLAMTWDDVTNTGSVKLYENGVQVAAMTGAPRMTSISDLNNWLGRSSFSSDANLQGSVAEFRIFNRLLSPAELMNDYQLGPAFAGNVIKWNGNLTTNWEVNTTSNWLAGNIPVRFQNSVAVQFDDTLAGTTNVAIAAAVSPSAVVVSNAAFNYIFSGSNGITGSATLTKLGAGTLTLNNSNAYTGSTFVNAGSLFVNGSLAAGSFVSVASGATLGGNGVINGAVTINSGGTISPGTGIGILKFTVAPFLNGRTLMEINRGAATNADKIIRAGGNLNYAGTLVVTNLGATLQSGDTFDLFDATSFSGSFSSLTLPALSTGLIWNTNDLPVNGTLYVTNIFFNLTYTADANGSISGSATQSVIYAGSGSAVTAVPNTGYAFTNWSDGSTANPRTDANITNNLTVTANFVPLIYTLSYNAGTNGSLTGTTPQSVTYGNSGSAVTAVPNAGFAFTNWSDGLTANPRTDSNVSSNLTVTANFISIFTGALPSPWTTNAIGNLTAATSATYSNGVFTIASAGTNISSNNDNFWFVNQPFTNDATLVARVVSQSGTNVSARAGVMMRENFSSGSRSVFVGLTPAGEAQWIRRTTNGGNSSITTIAGKPAPYWVRLTRSTNVFTGYVSGDGATWLQVASVSIGVNSNYTLGLAVCSGSGSALNTTIFDNVTVTNSTSFGSILTTTPSTPAIIGTLNLSADAISFTVTGETNSVWQLEESIDLINWTPLQSVGFAGGILQQQEADDARPQRFLRLHSIQ